jgi:tight adherence protein B
MSRRIVLIVLAAVAVTAAAVAASASAATVHVSKSPFGTFPERTWIVSLPKGQRVQRSQVTVTENDHDVVGLGVAPASVGGNRRTVLIIDTSNSMAGKPERDAFAAARTFAKRLNVNQQLAVMTFNNKIKTLTGFTHDPAQINAALSKVPATAYGTHVFDAVSQAIALTRTWGAGVGSVVVLTDGGDTGSKIPFPVLTKSARDGKIPVYTVALKGKTFHPLTLQKLANETGGSYSAAAKSADLRAIYDQLGLELAHQYALTYNSVEKPGKRVKVKITVDGFGSKSPTYQVPPLPAPPVPEATVADHFWASPWTMILFALLIPAVIGAAVYFSSRKKSSTVRTRVADYVSMPTPKSEADALVNRVFVGTERGLERTRWWTRYKDAVEFAEVPLTPTQLVFATVVLTLFAMWILSLIAGFWLALCGLLVPVLIRSLVLSKAERKRRQFGDQLPDNLDVLASGLRAGHSLIGALAVVVSNAPEPSKTEFQRVVADEQLGVPLEEALGGVAQRMRSRDMEQVVLVASVQGEAGGNVAEVLDRVTESIRERQEVRRLVRVLTAQGRLARWIVSALPVGLLIMISLLNKGYMKPLFTHTTGQIAVVGAALMIIAGSVVIGRIVDIKV